MKFHIGIRNAILPSLILWAIILWSCVAWGATVYVKPGSANPTTASQYKSGASSCSDASGWTDDSTLQAALNAAGSGGTLYICAGTYTNTMIDSTGGLDDTATNQTISSAPGLSQSSVVISGVGMGTAGHVVSLTHNGSKLVGLTLQYPPAGKRLFTAITGTGFEVDDCTFIWDDTACDGSYPTDHACTWNRCTFMNYARAGGYFPLDFQASTTEAVFNYCIFKNMITVIYLRYGTLTLNNCVFNGITSYACRLYANTNTKVMNVNNSIITSACNGDNCSPITNSSTSGETLTISNSLITASSYNATYGAITGTYVDGGGNILNNIPSFVSTRRPFILVFEVDDAVNLSTFQTIASKLEAYGWRGTYNVDTHEVSDWAPLSALAASGHEIASHTRHHANLANLGAMQVRYVGAGAACTMTISSGHLITTVDGVQDKDFTLASYSETGALCTAIDALADYTCLSASMTPDVPYAEHGMATALADVTNQDIKSDVYLESYDATRHYDEEITGSKTDIETNIPGYIVKTLAHPGDYVSAASKSAVAARGYTGCRVGTSGDVIMSSIDIFNIYGGDITSRIAQATLLVDAAKNLEYLGWIGGIYCLYRHDFTGFSTSDFDSLLAIVRRSGATVMTRAQAVDYIKANGTTADNRTYTRTFPDLGNYKLKSISPAINAGKDVGLTTDYLGRHVPYGAAPDIGAYEWYPSKGGKPFWSDPFHTGHPHYLFDIYEDSLN